MSMKCYEIKYKIKDPRYPEQVAYLDNWGKEFIYARGIVHASKLAKDHMREMQKVVFDKLEIQSIKELVT